MPQAAAPTSDSKHKPGASPQSTAAAGKQPQGGGAQAGIREGIRGLPYEQGAATVAPKPTRYVAAPTLAQVAAGSVLRVGDQGPAVRSVQAWLGVEADGFFGQQTRATLVQYQRAHGLQADGLVGPATLQALQRGQEPASEPPAAHSEPTRKTAPPKGNAAPTTATAAVKAGKPAPAPGKWQPAPDLSDVEKGDARLKVGMRGPAVSTVQALLGVSADGTFGAATQSAAVAFQRMAGLTPVSGEIGATTLQALRAASKGGVSADAQQQMDRLVAYGLSHHQGGSNGDCFAFVWRYIVAVGYGKIRKFNDCPDMQSGEARNFAEYMNAGQNAKRWGLRRLSISNPYDAPRGAIVVVGAGSPGTAHPTAGDIAVARGDGFFINDGPKMSYGDPASFARKGGRLLGAYVPAV